MRSYLSALTLTWALTACQTAVTDLGSSDAGHPSPDASHPSPDAGGPSPDAGIVDAGAPPLDAGAPPDAGMTEPDAGRASGEQRLTGGDFSVVQASIAYDQDGYRLAWVERSDSGDRVMFSRVDLEGTFTTAPVTLSTSRDRAQRLTRGSLSATSLAWGGDALHLQRLSSARPVLDENSPTFAAAHQWRVFESIHVGTVLMVQDPGLGGLRHVRLDSAGMSTESTATGHVGGGTLFFDCCLDGDRTARVAGPSTTPNLPGATVSSVYSWDGGWLGDHQQVSGAVTDSLITALAHSSDKVYAVWSAPRADNARRSDLYLSALGAGPGDMERILLAEDLSWFVPTTDVRVTPTAIFVAWIGSPALGGYNSVAELARVDRQSGAVERCILSEEPHPADHTSQVIMLDGPPEQEETAVVWGDPRDAVGLDGLDHLFFRRLAAGRCR